MRTYLLCSERIIVNLAGWIRVGGKEQMVLRHPADKRGSALGAGGFTLIELLVVVSIIGVIAAIALPNYTRIKEKAKEAETKAALHNIQVSLERFGVDHEGEYPPYLIGGERRAKIIQWSEDGRATIHVETIHPEKCTDPLLRYGYLQSSYPANPFISNTVSVQKFQGDMGDPLRSSFHDGREMGTRFGADGNIMGQALCDARWLTWLYIDPHTAELRELPTWSNIQYEFYDIWRGNQRKPFLPGSFLYKSLGEVVPSPDDGDKRDYINVDGKETLVPHNNRDQATYPVAITDYILSAWGGVRTKGMDLLGEEPLVLFSFKGTRRTQRPGIIFPPGGGIGGSGRGYIGLSGPSVDYIELMGIPPWTRGVNRSHVGPLWGSPFGPSTAIDRQLDYGNANGYKDALIIYLTPGRN
ncbi:prepilin-type N-terminal cleavage/methylation domain-containing protein [bacterium]|nr:prepilin-type N-terminal cleavage/methylation domain-containing protein [bacterium]